MTSNKINIFSIIEKVSIGIELSPKEQEAYDSLFNNKLSCNIEDYNIPIIVEVKK